MLRAEVLDGAQPAHDEVRDPRAAASTGTDDHHSSSSPEDLRALVGTITQAIHGQRDPAAASAPREPGFVR